MLGCRSHEASVHSANVCDGKVTQVSARVVPVSSELLCKKLPELKDWCRGMCGQGQGPKRESEHFHILWLSEPDCCPWVVSWPLRCLSSNPSPQDSLPAAPPVPGQARPCGPTGHHPIAEGGAESPSRARCPGCTGHAGYGDLAPAGAVSLAVTGPAGHPSCALGIMCIWAHGRAAVVLHSP